MATPIGGSTDPVVTDAPDQATVTPAAKMVQPGTLAFPDSWHLPTGSLAERLFREGYAFEFFQAVRLLEKLCPEAVAVGRVGPPDREVVRLRPRISLDFPPSAIYQLAPPTTDLRLPSMTVAFLGLTGPSGVLPRHYTELLLRLEREGKGPEKFALRDWLDLFNHRFLSLFFRAWEKYRFCITFERGEFARREPDAFTRGLFSLIGLGMPSFRNRLRICWLEKGTRSQEPGAREKWRETSGQGRLEQQPDVVSESWVGGSAEKILARLEDLSLLRFGGFFAHRPRCAISLEGLLSSYLKLPVQVQQYQGQWIRLEKENQSALNAGNNLMGRSVVVGDRIWDIQGKIRIRIGPLNYAQFLEFLPDRAPIPQRKAIFLLAQLVRFYVGLEIDVEFQLVLKATEVPSTRMGQASSAEKGTGQAFGSRLGWNTWGRRLPMHRVGDDAVFQADERTWLI